MARSPSEQVMKQKFLVCMALILLALCLCGAALADEKPEVTIKLSENRFNGPADVALTITVTNPGNTAMPGPCRLYDPQDQPVVDFGAPILAAGESRSWTGVWHVTQEHLAAGKMIFKLSYTVATATGELIDKVQPYEVTVVNAGAEARLNVERTITPGVARKSQKVYVTYTVTNSGNAEATDVVLKESSAISSSEVKLGSIAPGQTVSHTFTVTMGTKNLASKATITYKANGRSGSVAVDESTIRYENVKLTATLSADKKGGYPGEVVKLKLTLKNTGKNDISGITVTDPVLGTVFTDLSVEAGDSLTKEVEVTVSENATHIFSVTGTDEAGKTIQTATEQLGVIAVDPDKNVTLAVTAEVDSANLYTLPGDVTFTVHVTNTSAVEATKIKVVSDGKKLYPYTTGSSTFSLAPGETVTFSRKATISIEGNFRFDAQTVDQLGETLTFSSNLIHLQYAPPTPTPRLSELTPPPTPVLEDVPDSIEVPENIKAMNMVMNTGFLVALFLALGCVALIAIGLTFRASRAAHSRQAADNLERTEGSDYTHAVSPRRRRYLPDDEEPTPADSAYPEDGPADVPAPFAGESEEAVNMADTMDALYPEVNDAEEASPQDAPFGTPRAGDDPFAGDLPFDADAPAGEVPPTAEPFPTTEAPQEEVYRRRQRKQQD